MYNLGQLCGLLAAGIKLIQPQLPKRIYMLLCTVVINILSALNFVLIGRFGATVLLCLVAVCQGIVALVHEIRKTSVSRVENLVFFLLYLGFGILGMVTAKDFVWGISLKNLMELLPILGAMMLMLSVFAKDAQKTRVFILLNGLFWLIYTIHVRSTTFFTSLIAILSASAALWKYRKKG